MQLGLVAFSLFIYLLVISFIREYINIQQFGFSFFIKVLIIVAGSWGIISLLEFIYNKLFPSYDQTILRTVQAEKDMPDRLITQDNIDKHNDSFY